MAATTLAELGLEAPVFRDGLGRFTGGVLARLGGAAEFGV
jgi:hypothetical protein